MAATSRAPADSRAARRDPGGRARLRLRGRRHRQDVRPRRALRPRDRPGHRRRLDPRHHLHRARRRRAALADPRAARQARPARADPRARRRLDLDDPRLLPAPARSSTRSPPGSTRASACWTRARRRCSASRRSTRRWPSSAAGGAPDRLGLLATYGSAALRRMLDRRLRDASRRRPAARAPARRRAVARAAGRWSSARSRAGSELVELLDRRPAVESLLDLSGFAVKGDDDYEQARTAVEQAALNEVAARDRALLEELLQAFERSYQAAKDRESALDFEDLQLRARDLLASNDAIREREQLRFRQVCVDEFQDTNRLQCEVIDLISARRPLLRRRRVPVDLPLPPRRRRRLQGAARGRRRRAAADRELALAAGGARGRQPALRRDLRRRVPAPGRRRALPRPGLGPGGRAARHRQVELQGHRRARGGEARRRRSRGA